MTEKESNNDADFLFHARTYTPALIAEVRRQREAREQAEAALSILANKLSKMGFFCPPAFGANPPWTEQNVADYWITWAKEQSLLQNERGRNNSSNALLVPGNFPENEQN